MNLQRPAVEAAASKAEAKPQGEGAGLAPWLAWSTWVLFTTLIIISLVLTNLNNRLTLPDNIIESVLGAPALFAYATVGALIASRRPENPIGWIFCVAALLIAFAVFAEEYTRYALVTRPYSLPGGDVMAWLTAWPRSIGFATIITFLLLLFPNGQLLSRRWRVAAWLAAVEIVLIVVWDAFRPGPLTFVPQVSNPLGIKGADSFFELLANVWADLLLIAIGVCVASVIARFRRAKGDERQQLKWFTYAAVLLIAQFGIVALANLLFSIHLPEVVRDSLQLVSIAAFPIAAGIAILKYRLYDIDLLINRTLVYVPLTGILAGLYAASIAFFQRLFLAITGERSDAAIVITTLILASSFTPIKNSVQTVVDKRFKEAPDPTKKLRAFGEQVGTFVQLNSPERLTQRLLDEATAAFNATGGAVYLGQHGHLRLVHASDDWDGEAQISVPLKSHGEQLGLVSLGERRNGLDYTPQDRQALQEIVDVVAQAIEVAGRAR